LIVHAVQARGRIEDLSCRLSELESEIGRLKREQGSAKPAEPAPTTVPTPPVKAATPSPIPPPSTPMIGPEMVPESPLAEIAPGVLGIPAAPPITPTKPVPGPKPAFTLPTREQILERQREGSPAKSAEPAPASVPPPVPPRIPPIEPAAVPPLLRPTGPAINWEQFLGVKGFAWAAGLAFFLCVAFAIKYSFDHNLISPGLRMAFGFLTGIALLIGGAWLHRRKQYAVGAQTLCA